ncbi:MAG TPA: nuclear transport factor 2 family protein [Mycobacterium sp.]|nr:nuclear transport factor 2 family protein [Mycobacterium sp.]
MTVTKEDVFAEFGVDTRPDAELTREEIIARNLKVVDAHFHTENPDEVEKAVALYTPDISWEAPSRGMVYKDPEEVLKAYRKIFQTFSYRKTIALRRFATENFVFDDQIGQVKVTGDPADVPNMPYEHGTEMSVRLVHCFEMRDGMIAREIAYEVWRKLGAPNDNDDIPEDAHVEVFPYFP